MKPYNSFIQILGKDVMIGGFYGVRTEEMSLNREYRGAVKSVDREKLTLKGIEYLGSSYHRQTTKNKFEQLEIRIEKISSFIKLD